MTSFSLRATWVGALLAGGVTAFAPHLATAQECSTASDCNEGYRCEFYTYESCNGWACEAGDPRCPDPVPEPVCYDEEYTSCVQAPCASNADCPDRMVCHAQPYYVCDGGMAGAGGSPAACAPGEMCPTPDPVEPPSCWEEAGDSLCTPRYQLPCTVASDCGGGFDCIEAKYWVCSGSGMAGAGGVAGTGSVPGIPEPADAGMPGSPDEPMPFPDDFECHEESSGTFYCQLQDLPCSADADCPDGLECKDNYVYPPCMGGAGTGAAGDGMDPGDYECPEPTLEKRCMPPEYYGGGGPRPGIPPGVGSGGSTAGGSADGGVEDPGGPVIGNPGPGTGTGSGGMGGGDNAGEPAPGDDEGETDPPTDDDGTANGGGGDADSGGGGSFGWLTGGCSAGGPIGADPLGWLTFGLVALVMRRRARRPA